MRLCWRLTVSTSTFLVIVCDLTSVSLALFYVTDSYVAITHF